MLEEKDLSELLQYQPSAPILSVYMNLDPAERLSWQLKLRNLAHGMEPSSAKDVRRAEQYLFETNREPPGRSVALFSCLADNFLRVFSFPMPIRSRARWTPRAYVKPLADLLDSYGGYGVALVDKQSLRLFYFHLGHLVESDTLEGEEIHHLKSGAASARVGLRGGSGGADRHEEEVEHRNIQASAEIAAKFFQRREVRRIVLGGTDETLAEFQDALPKAWRSLIVGTFPAQKSDTHSAILENAMQQARKTQTAREAALVDEVLGACAKGKGAAVGLGKILHAVREGRVHTLILGEGFRAPGKRCPICGLLEADNAERCPYCEGDFEPIEDAVELAVQTVWRRGGEVEVVHNNQALNEAGRIAALCWY